MDVSYPTREDLQLVDVLHALSDPVRLEIVRNLAEAEGEIACGQIPLPVGKSTTSHHYKVLREAGVASCRDEGARRFHSLRREDLDARFPGLLDTVLRAATT
jgi:DNA-binding transcriptional ArsR family regulator